MKINFKIISGMSAVLLVTLFSMKGVEFSEQSGLKMEALAETEVVAENEMQSVESDQIKIKLTENDLGQEIAGSSGTVYKIVYRWCPPKSVYQVRCRTEGGATCYPSWQPLCY